MLYSHKIIDGVAQMLHRIAARAARIGLDSLAAAPQNENFRAKFGAQIHRAHRFLHGVSADFRIARGKRAVAKNRMREERNRRHRHDEAVLFARALERRDDRVALVRRRVDRHEIVVVQVDAPRADFGQASRRCRSAKSPAARNRRRDRARDSLPSTTQM